MIQTNFTPGKIQRILEGEEPSQQFYSKAFGRYHVAIEEGLNTTTQRQMQLAQMITLRNEAGINFSEEDLLEVANIQNKKRILDNLAKQKQEQQQQVEQQQQMMAREMESKIELNQARSESDRGLGLERASRVEENHALSIERKAAAIKDEQQGLLALIKSMKEIDTVDLNHIQQLITIQNIMQQRQKANEQINAGDQTKEAEAIAAVSRDSRNRPQEAQASS